MPRIRTRARFRADILRFPMVKVLDYQERLAELESTSNPFALVVLAHLETHAAAADTERPTAKLGLIRRLYERGYGRDDKIQPCRFIDWLLVLPAAMEAEKDRFTAELEGAATMPYVTSTERRAKEEGRREGQAEGLREGLLEAIELGLELRVGEAALRVAPRARAIAELGRLQELKSALKRVASIEGFESMLGGE